jgi:hypothetical protein
MHAQNRLWEDQIRAQKKFCAHLVRSVAFAVAQARIERIGINRFAKAAIDVAPQSPGQDSDQIISTSIHA